MKAIIMAAGKSTRTYPLTLNRPKPLLKIANKTIIEHNLEQLSGLADEAIIIVGFESKQITDCLKDYKKIKISFVEQKQQLGTASAVAAAEKQAGDKFIVMNGDDLFSKEDIKKCIKHDWCLLASPVAKPENFGIVEAKDGLLLDLAEKPKNPKSNLANTGLYVATSKIFEIIKKLKKSPRGEYELTDAVKEIAKKEKFYVEEAKFWVPITYPWSLLEANELLLKGIKKSIQGVVEKGAVMHGEVVVGKGSIIKSGVYIEGPAVIGENSKIGPNCYIRASTTIGNNCHVGNAVEIKNSILFDGTNAAHLSYVGDSVLGEKVNLGAGTITANLRHDNANIKSMLKNELIDTGRRKFGTIIGDNAHTGIHTSIYPGRKIWPNKSTMPGEIVTKDIM